ncbi:MAG: bifunctional ornithine acetyltransferase/N-acetylglutamate synthase, partial [Parasporobacterium sp.]|nr:bifunctional ornithine acetyltransferase/N-acetylglutamate synthase [Parasporobacterium sp.]
MNTLRKDINMKRIEGGVCAAKGFTANGVHCGLRKDESRLDLAMIYSQVPASAAAVYTTNLVKGAPILVDQKNLADGVAQAVIVNSGNANTCNSNGVEIAEGMCRLTAEAVGIKAEDVIVASTGVIGQKLSLDPVISGMAPLAAGLSAEGSSKAAGAIMTTDTIMKEAAVEFELDGKTCHLGGISKGSGMIH